MLSAAILCLSNALGSATVAVPAFTLAWTHSIEKIRWEEDWRVADDALRLETARVRGSGAGMEPPPDAVLQHGVWEWHPGRTESMLRLTRSSFTPDYVFCTQGERGGQDCRPLGDLLPSDGGVTEVFPCPR